MSTKTTYAQVVEGIRATIAAYAQALDDGRTDDVVATFCPDGVCEIPGMGTHEGHHALREAYSGWKPKRPQRSGWPCHPSPPRDMARRQSPPPRCLLAGSAAALPHAAGKPGHGDSTTRARKPAGNIRNPRGR